MPVSFERATAGTSLDFSVAAQDEEERRRNRYLQGTSLDFVGAPAERERGILGSILHELGQDLLGATRTVGAVAFSPFDVLGANVPVSFDDLTSRDVKGALMVGAMVASGFVSSAARGTALAKSVASRGAIGKIGAAAGAEAVAGAAFGLMRPLEEGEDRASALVGDIGDFTAFGAGFSVVGLGTKRLFGGLLGSMRQAIGAESIMKAAERIPLAQQAREAAGFSLLNPSTGSIATVSRIGDGSVILSVGGTTKTFGEIPTALAAAGEQGFIKDIGFASGINTQELLKQKLKRIGDKEVARRIAAVEKLRGEKLRPTEVDEAVERILKQADEISEMEANRLLNLTDEATDLDRLRALEAETLKISAESYQELRLAAKQFAAGKDEMAVLAAEIAAPADELGLPNLGSQTSREQAAKMAGISPEQAKTMRDHEILEAVVRAGVLDVATIQKGLDHSVYVRELALNGMVPDGSLDIMTSTVKDSFMLKVLTPLTVGKMHPEVMPVVREAIRRHETTEQLRRQSISKARDALVPLSKKQRNLVAQIIDESSKAPRGSRTRPDLKTAREIAVKMAEARNMPEVAAAIRSVTDLLAEYEERLVAAGLLEKGISGYFPIVNVGRWKLEIFRPGSRQGEFHGLYNSKRAAQKALAEAREKFGAGTRGNTIANDLIWDSDYIQPDKAYEALRGRIGAASGPLKHRKLGMRDWSVEPLEAMERYIGTVERVLNWHDFKALANSVEISAEKRQLQQWFATFTDDLAGVPRSYEQKIQGFVDAVNAKVFGDSLPIPDRAVKRWGSAIRSWESFVRLGGVASGAVNLTQIPLNTYSVLGAKWTAEGMKVFAGPDGGFSLKAYRARVDEMVEAGVGGIEHFVPLSREGGGILEEGIRATFKREWSDSKIKAAANATSSTALFLFNKAEQVNRVVSAWGAFRRAKAAGKPTAQAAGEATRVVERTQFVWNSANMPDLLRHPAGATLGQFKSFVVNEIEFIAGLSANEARRFGAMMYAMGGAGLVMNMPGTGLLDAAGRAFFDRTFMEGAETSDLPETLIGRGTLYGLPGLFGVDVTDFVGIGTLRDISSGLFGPAAKDAGALTTFITEAAKDVAAGVPISDDVKRTFVQQTMPSAMRRVLRAQDILSSGEVRNPYTGKLIYRPADRYWNALTQGVGFPTVEASQERAADAVAARVSAHFRENRTVAAREIATLILRGQLNEAAMVQQRANELGFGIDRRTVQWYVRDLQKPAAQRRRERTPTQLRQELDDLFEVTGGFLPPP